MATPGQPGPPSSAQPALPTDGGHATSGRPARTAVGARAEIPGSDHVLAEPLHGCHPGRLSLHRVVPRPRVVVEGVVHARIDGDPVRSPRLLELRLDLAARPGDP